MTLSAESSYGGVDRTSGRATAAAAGATDQRGLNRSSGAKAAPLAAAGLLLLVVVAAATWQNPQGAASPSKAVRDMGSVIAGKNAKAKQHSAHLKKAEHAAHLKKNAKEHAASQFDADAGNDEPEHENEGEELQSSSEPPQLHYEALGMYSYYKWGAAESSPFRFRGKMYVMESTVGHPDDTPWPEEQGGSYFRIVELETGKVRRSLRAPQRVEGRAGGGRQICSGGTERWCNTHSSMEQQGSQRVGHHAVCCSPAVYKLFLSPLRLNDQVIQHVKESIGHAFFSPVVDDATGTVWVFGTGG